MRKGYTREKAGRVADVLAQAGVFPEFRQIHKMLGKFVHEPGEAHDLWVRMSEPRLGKDRAMQLADLMTHFGWAPRQNIMPDRPFLETKQHLTLADLTQPHTIQVMDTGLSSEHNSLGTVQSLGAGEIFRKQPGQAGSGFGFRYFTKTSDGMPIRAKLKVGDRILNPGDSFWEPK